MVNESFSPDESKEVLRESYSNPFSTSKRPIDPFSLKLTNNQDVGRSMDAIQFKQDKVEEPARKWKVDLKSDVVHSIQLYREKYERYLKTVNNTANKDVWKVYDHVAEDLFNELMGQALN